MLLLMVGTSWSICSACDRTRQHLLHLRRQRAYGLGLRLHHVAYALVVLPALLAVLVELSHALVALALELIGEAVESGVEGARQ